MPVAFSWSSIWVDRALFHSWLRMDMRRFNASISILILPLGFPGIALLFFCGFFFGTTQFLHPELNFCSCYLHIPSNTSTTAFLKRKALPWGENSAQNCIVEEKSVTLRRKTLHFVEEKSVTLKNSVQNRICDEKNVTLRRKLCPELHCWGEKRYTQEKNAAHRKALHWGEERCTQKSVTLRRKALHWGEKRCTQKSVTLRRKALHWGENAAPKKTLRWGEKRCTEEKSVTLKRKTLHRGLEQLRQICKTCWLSSRRAKRGLRPEHCHEATLLIALNWWSIFELSYRCVDHVLFAPDPVHVYARVKR